MFDGEGAKVACKYLDKDSGYHYCTKTNEKLDDSVVKTTC
jgi:hypothetical protein